MAETTEGGAFGEFKHGERKNNEANDAEDEGGLDGPDVFLSPLFKT